MAAAFAVTMAIVLGWAAYLLYVDARPPATTRGTPIKAFAVATAASALIFIAVFAVLSLLAGVGLGWSPPSRVR